MKLEEHIPDSDPKLRDLILLISKQAAPIKEAFLAQKGLAGTENIYGEEQMALDKWADQHLIGALRASGLVAQIASEEQPEIVMVEGVDDGCGVTLDPLDGSSLIGVNLSVGTIVGIFRGGDVLRPGTEMAAALYILYGPLTTLTYTLGADTGVHEFIMASDGTFELEEENIKVPSGKIYAPGALRKEYLPEHQKWIEDIEEKGYKVRFSGSFVADVHQILHKGGVFTYPGFVGREEGKLRLLFECNPIGFIITAAGGRVSDGKGNLLEVMPEKLDHRIPVYVGTKEDVEARERLSG